MNKKLMVGIISAVSVLSMGLMIFANPLLSKEKKVYYDNKQIEENKENEAIGFEMLKIAQLPEGPEREEREKKIKERENKYKNESAKTAENAKTESYMPDKNVIDSNAKLIKKLEGLKSMYELDIRTASDKSETDFETKNFSKTINLLEKVKKSDESKFGELLTEFNQMTESFKKERPIFEKEQKNKNK